MRAKLAYFYGWTHDYIGDLPNEVAQMYWLAITEIEAQEMLKQIKISDFPHLKKQSRNATIKSLELKAHRSISGEATVEEMIRMANG